MGKLMFSSKHIEGYFNV